VAGLSLGGVIGIWLAAKYPDRVKTLSAHSAWPKSDAFLSTVVDGWRTIARGLGNVPDMIVTGIFPWCFTPNFYSGHADYIASLADFVRGRPVQPVEAFLQQSAAVQSHDVQAQLEKVGCPTLVTFGGHDVVTSTRFADALTGGIKGAELVVFEDCSHAPIYQDVAGFNERSLAFLQQHIG
jgi:3-oxoadipate enol-lactonase